MKTHLVLAALLVGAAVSLVPSAAAQQSGSLILHLSTPAEPLAAGESATVQGIAELVVDATAYATSFSGIPVDYAVTGAPAWASVVISPASDVFPLHHPAPPGPTVVVHRPITITVTANEGPTTFITEIVSIEGMAVAGMGGRSFVGHGAVPVTFEAPEKACDDALTHEQKEALLREAAAAYESYEAQRGSSDADEPEEVVVQGRSASVVRTPWIAVAAFALVGAGVGLALRRRLAR